ncbi:uncharacterized protein METZ01_LOCUS325033, partial [marine metagenome]
AVCGRNYVRSGQLSQPPSNTKDRTYESHAKARRSWLPPAVLLACGLRFRCRLSTHCSPAMTTSSISLRPYRRSARCVETWFASLRSAATLGGGSTKAQSS